MAENHKMISIQEYVEDRNRMWGEEVANDLAGPDEPVILRKENHEEFKQTILGMGLGGAKIHSSDWDYFWDQYHPI